MRLVDAFETSTHLCFVTELASYGDLQGLFDALPARRAPEHVARHFFAEALLGLEETHRMGFLYRDLKPGNLLLSRSGHVRLADLGLAKRLHVDLEDSSVPAELRDESEQEESFRLVGHTTTFVGTRRYMSPEHLHPARTGSTLHGYGAPADIWALGVTLYLLLTGDYPFARRVSAVNVAEMFYAIHNEKIEYPEWLSADAVGILQGLLNRDAQERLGIAEIKSHPWMRGVDWARVKEDSLRDVPQEDVLALLQEHGIGTIEDRVGNTFEKALYDGKMFSSISAASTESERRRKSPEPTFELLGFDYAY